MMMTMCLYKHLLSIYISCSIVFASYHPTLYEFWLKEDDATIETYRTNGRSCGECHFPFTYEGEMYYGCRPYEDLLRLACRNSRGTFIPCPTQCPDGSSYVRQQILAISGPDENSVILQCFGWASPNPSVTWTRGIDVIGVVEPDPGTYPVFTNTSITLKYREEDYGLYACNFNNSYSSTGAFNSESYSFEGRRLPLQAKNLAILSQKRTYVTLEWDQDVDVEFDYEIVVTPEEMWRKERKIRRRNKVEQIKYLDPGAKYEFKVRRINKYGYGLYSDPVYATIPEDAPLDGPINAEIFHYNSTSVGLTWQLEGDDVTGYGMIRITPGFWDKDQSIMSFFEDRRVITGLTPDTEYKMKIEMELEGQYKGRVETLHVTTPTEPGRPNKPTNLRITQQIRTYVTLHWEYEKPEDTREMSSQGETKFRIKAKRIESDLKSIISVTNETTYKFKHLEPGVKYEFQVKGVNSYGDGAYCDPVSTTIPSEAPLDKPVNITSSVTSTSVTLKWEMEGDDDPTESRQIFFSPGYYGDTQSSTDLFFGNEWTVAGLKQNTEYKFEVALVIYWTSKRRSEPVYVTTLPPVPDVAASLRITGVTVTSVSLRWRIEGDVDPKGTNTIYVTPGFSGNNQSSIGPFYENYQTIQGLLPNTKYTFEVEVNSWNNSKRRAEPVYATTSTRAPSIKYLRINNDHHDKVILTCEAFGGPAPEIIWKRNDEPLPATVNVSVNPNVSITRNGVHVRSVLTTPRTAFVYTSHTCEANNSDRTVQKTVVIPYTGNHPPVALEQMTTDLYAFVRKMKEDLHAEINSIKEDLHAEINSIKEDLLTEVNSIKEDLHIEVNIINEDLHTKVNSIKEDLEGLKEDLKTIKNSMNL